MILLWFVTEVKRAKTLVFSGLSAGFCQVIFFEGHSLVGEKETGAKDRVVIVCCLAPNVFWLEITI